MEAPRPPLKLLLLVSLIGSLARHVSGTGMASLAGRYHQVKGLDCVSSKFVRIFRPMSVKACASLCDFNVDCQAFSIASGPCRLFVFNWCSNYVRLQDCRRKCHIYIKQQPALPPGALCPAGFMHDYRGTKYLRVKDASSLNQWTFYKEKCWNLPGLVTMADAVTRDILDHLYNVFLYNYADRTIPWNANPFPGGYQRLSVALDFRQFNRGDRSEPAGGWYWDTCRVPLDASFWDRGQPDNNGGGVEHFGFFSPMGGLNDGPLGLALAGAFCKCVSPFD